MRSRLAATLTVLACAAVLAEPRPALAQPAEQRPLQLVFEAAADVPAACTNREVFEDEVAARLGYSPFSIDGDGGLRVSLVAEAGRIRARLSVDRPNAAPVERELFEDPPHCAELLRALAVVASSAIEPGDLDTPPPWEMGPDPQSSPATVSTPDPAPPPEPSPPPFPPPVPTPPAAEAPAPTEYHVENGLFAGAGVFGGVLPSESGLAFGLLTGVRTVWSPGFATRAQLLWHPPNSLENRTGSVEAQRVVASVSPCLRSGALDVCALVSAGALIGHGREVATDRVDVSSHVSTGVLAGATLALGPSIALGLLGSLEASLIRSDLQTNGTTVWSTPLISGGGAMMLAVQLP